MRLAYPCMATDPRETCWTLIHDAASGNDAARGLFAEHYEPVLRAYFGARWRGAHDVSDAVQEVFVEAFKDGGLLSKVDGERPGGFRAFLYGAARRVAQRHEEGRGRAREERLATGHDAPSDESELTVIFDRAWARSMMRQAADQQARDARGDESRERRVELLRLRFQEELPVREIAARFGEAPERVHKWYAKAREEFRASLLTVLAFHGEGTAGKLEERAEELLRALG